MYFHPSRVHPLKIFPILTAKSLFQAKHKRLYQGYDAILELYKLTNSNKDNTSYASTESFHIHILFPSTFKGALQLTPL